MNNRGVYGVWEGRRGTIGYVLIGGKCLGGQAWNNRVCIDWREVFGKAGVNNRGCIDWSELVFVDKCGGSFY